MSRIRPIPWRGLAVATLLILGHVAAAQTAPQRAAVASAHPLASAAGIEVLQRGGNAFDAAIAVAAALGVVEPYGSGIGGGGFFLLRRAADDFEVMIDARETAPLAASRDMYLDAAGEPVPGASVDGALSAGIPGLPAGLAYLAEHFGELALADSLAPAIRHAREGFPADSEYIARLERRSDVMNAAARETLMPEGALPREGDLVLQPELAATLESLARGGFSGFYEGPVAQKLVAGVRAGGGIWALEDLSAYEVVERQPLVGHYRSVRVVTAAPPSSGGVALLNMLNMLAGYDLSALDDAARVHLLAEVMRRAHRDRAEFLGDPDFVDVPVERLIHPYYAAGQRISIHPERATPSLDLPGFLPSGPAGGDQTSHFSVLDAEGNAVAATQSINFSFGSGYMPAGTGVLLNDEMDDFSVKPGVPNGYQLLGSEANAIAPGKRMLSSMTPTILIGDNGMALLGTPGGSRIITMVLLAGLAWMDGADAVSMTALPRIHHQYFPDEIYFEGDALDEADVDRLRAMGHSLSEVGRAFGNMQVVTWDFASGTVDAAADPRGIGEPRFSAP
ncbi:MAG TPA: gamma-glutamyltransferase [Gammaproteobacteria bacterium]|jgi:gamma-glutamyltranspeptidase/glutathione hydrolase